MASTAEHRLNNVMVNISPMGMTINSQLSMQRNVIPVGPGFFLMQARLVMTYLVSLAALLVRK